jgi:hypothetical protein
MFLSLLQGPLKIFSVNFGRKRLVKSTPDPGAGRLEARLLPQARPHICGILFTGTYTKHRGTPTWDRCYDFLKIFAEEFSKNGVFDSKQS